MLEKAVQILENKKARNINVIDIRDVSTLAEYFVICSGTSNRHIQSLADSVDEEMSLSGFEKLRIEGYDSKKWIIIDYGEVIIHIFDKQYREYYDIERIWSDGILLMSVD